MIDELAHDCLQHGAAAGTKKVIKFTHNDADSLRFNLQRIRTGNPDSAILVVTESLFSMDSDSPDFDSVIAACREVDACLMVDVAHDLGALGAGGRGILGDKELLNEVDFLIGSFSKSFATIGGFFASKESPPAYYVRAFSGSYTFSNYLMPAQVAACQQALKIVKSKRGEELRLASFRNCQFLREKLIERELEVIGQPSPMAIVVVGEEHVARVAYRHCLENGVILNCIEFPACRIGLSRFRMQVTPHHTLEQLSLAANIVGDAIALARNERQELGSMT